jgi:serine/threonine protein kinase
MDTPRSLEFLGNARFVIQRRLGEGGMGIVYLAHDVERDMPVALKTLSRLDATGISCLKNEFRSLSDVVHPNLVTLHELICEDGHWFLTMEVVNGVSFASWVRESSLVPPDMATSSVVVSPNASPEFVTKTTSRAGAFSEGVAPGEAAGPPPPGYAPTPWCDLGRLRGALRQLVEGVLAIHAAGKLHRDLKPSNVLVTDSGRVVILDFGLAIAQDLRGSRQAAGTPAYMAPEQVSAQELTPASDWYAVGTMLYQALTGHLPFSGTSSEMLSAKRKREPPPPSTLVGGIPEDLERLCVDCLRLSPAQRPSGRDILHRLDGEAAQAVQAVPEASVFLGREEQLAQLHQAFASVRSGVGVTVYVSGRSGMGKTALIHHFLDELRGRENVRVLEGRCYERESMPYKAWDSLVDALASRLGELPVAQRTRLLPEHIHELARVFPVLCGLGISPPPLEPGSPGGDQSDSRQRAFNAFKELLRRLAEQQPLVLYIDDLQWGDVDSARLMASLFSHPAPPLLLLGGYRREEEETSEFFHALKALRAGPPLNLGEVRRVDIDRLSLEEGARLARTLLGPEGASAGELPRLITREAEGSPFFIAEFARHVREREKGAGEATLQGLSLENVLLHRVRQLPDTGRRLLEILSVATRPFEQGLAAGAAGLTTEATAAFGLLRAAHLIRTHGARARNLAEPYHDRIRETVAGALDEARLRECHRLLAESLEKSGEADPEMLAVHLEGAGETARAMGYALLAAERAEASLAFERAATLYRRALAWSGPGHEAQLRLRLAHALINAGRGVEAAPLLLASAEGRKDAEAIELRRRAAEQLLVSGYIDEGSKVLRDVLTGVGIQYPETTTRAALLVIARLVRLRLRGMRFRERRVEEIPAEQLLRIDICYSAGKGLVLVDPLRGFGFLTKQLLLALESGEPRRIALGLCHYATNLGTAGKDGYPRAMKLLALAQSIGERFDDAFVLGTVGNCQAAAEMCIGQWRATVERVTRANDILRKRCSGAWWEIHSGVVFSEVSLLCMGRLHELSGLVNTHARSALDRGDLFAATYSRVHTWYEPIAADDVARASAEMRDTMGRWSQGGFHIMHYWALYGETQYALYAGEALAARERLARAWPALASTTILRIQFLRILITLLRGSTAVAAAQACQGEEAKRLLRAAEDDASRLAKERTGWADAAASLLRACILGGRGRPGEAVRQLEAAIQGFDAAEMALHAACARRRKGQLLGGEEGRALIAAADARMREQGIKNPARWAALYTPGFSDSSRS